MINELHELLITRNMTIATAESCTGGLIAASLSDLSGSSQYFQGSVVSYANAVKIGMLGVSDSTLKQFGAVSRETAIAMVLGLEKAIPSNIGIAVTGIAGPTGGTAEKPVGTVWIALRIGETLLHTEVYNFSGSRSAVRSQTVNKAIALVHHHIARDH